MDRNLWARTAWDPSVEGNGFSNNNIANYNTDSDYYWYYYKFWNNYWFVWGSTNYYVASNWTQNDWWQWPCPNGYHVPSATEWQGIYSAWNNSQNKTISGLETWVDFAKYLKLPSAGLWMQEYSFGYAGSKGYYWSSTKKDYTLSHRLLISSSNIQIANNDGGRCSLGYGQSVRCMMDNPKTITLNLNGWTWVNEINIPSWTKATAPTAPTRTDYDFAGWYTDDETFQNKFDFDNEITEDVELYAKWVQCGAGETYYPELWQCATRDENNVVYYWTDERWNWVISIKDPDGDTILTMMDKNLWASEAGTSSSSYWYHFQRWNNYGFAQWCNIWSNCSDNITSVATNTKADYKNYRPWNRYSNDTFIKGSNNYWNAATIWGSSVSDFDVLWWWLWDADTTTSVDTFWWWVKNWDTRQWPCAPGYHVPSIWEWNALITYWYNAKNPLSKKSLTTLNRFSDSSFNTDFKLPIAGERSNSAANLIYIFYGDSYGYYWSSSPDSESSNLAHYLILDSSNVGANAVDKRAYGFSVRCFKDHPDAPETLTLTFDENGGDLLWASGSTLNQLVASWKLAQQPVEPTKVGYTFTGWTTERDGTSVFNFSNPVTVSWTLYAKWESDCPAWEEYVESKDKCLPSRAIIRDSVSGEIIQINDMEWDDLNIYFLKADWTTGYYTMMDRNMWATEVYNQNYDNQNIASYWYYYKWWNNYWFTWGDSSFASASYWTQNDWWQWPCPEWYHVLTSGDWNNLYTYWGNSNTVVTNKWQQWASDLLLSYAGRWTSKISSGTDGYYWSSSRVNSPRTINFYSDTIIAGLYFSSSYGYSVRCLKNSPNSQTLTLHANGWTKAVIAFTGTVSDGKFTALWTPSRENSVFSWWYDAEVWWNKLEMWSAVVPDLYARWECDSHSIEVNGECILLKVVTFDSRGWTEIDLQKIFPGEFAIQPATNPTRDNSEFKWWYLEDSETAFDFEHTAITEDITLNAKWKCNTWYIEKWEACVESAVVTFDTNGWSPKASVEIEKWTKLKGIVIKYSHTPNIDDAWVQSWNYANYLSNNHAIKIPESKKLYVSLKYATEANYDYLYIFKWMYTWTLDGNMDAWQLYTFNWDSSDTLNTTGFYVDWDEVTFSFYSDSSQNYYWYYAVISGSYDKMWENPTNGNWEFVGWYLSWSDTLFDPENTNITGDTTLYAKWLCNSWYTEVNWECIQQFTVEFEAYTNGWLVNMSWNLVASWSIKVASWTEINLSDYVAVNDPTSYIWDGWVFDGWWTIPERQFKITSPTLVITWDITLHALFYKIYESYFELQDINAWTLSSNTWYCTWYNWETSCDLIIPTFTENDWYIFDGFSNSQWSTWTIDSYTIWNTYYTVTHETTPISVTFNVNGNSWTTETRECYKYNGSDICLIKSPDITPAIWFTKIWWSTDVGTHTNEWNVNTLSGVSANSTYYAQSKKDKVTLNISYGTWVWVSSISKISDSCDLAEVWNGTSQATSCTVTAPDIALKSGYWTGVWTKDTNPSVIKNPWDDIELTSNDSYTASAIATVYPISYHENGWTLVWQKTSYTVEEDFTLVTPNRDSYVFEWWTWSNGDNPQKTVTVNSWTVTWPLNYYANWTPITYTIAFNWNAVNVEWTQSSIDATYDSGDTAPESNFTRPGYTFTSWNTQSDGNGINYDTWSELKNLTNTSWDVVTLYAIWQANTDTPYTVHYYLENIDDENYTFDSTDGKAWTTDDEISIDTLKKEITWAHFEKAAVVVSNQWPEYWATTTVDNITISWDGNTEVYLFYKRNTHTVTAIAWEWVGSVSWAWTYKYGQTVTLTPWNINSCYTANSKTFIMPDNDVQETLNGVIKKFTVTLNKDSHISSVQWNWEYNCGVEVNVSATPNVWYEFVRWEKNSTQVSAQSSYTFTITESVVLNAVSKAQNGITYTVRHWIRDVGANTYAKYSEESKSWETDSPITLENEKISVPCGTYAEWKENWTVKTTTIIKWDGSTVIDLYYSRNSYTVTISKDSWILSVSNSASHECGAGVTITATPKTWYSFNRYSSTDVDSSINNPYTFTMPDKAVSIQAQSNANTYTVNFNANGWTWTMSQQTFMYDISQQLSDNLFTRTWYIFTWWSIDSWATVPTYTNKQSVDNLATTWSITLYAIWTTKWTSTKYTVRHIKQGLSTPTDDVVETQELYAETNSVQTPAVNTYSGFNSPSVGNITVSANGNASIDYVYTRKNITLTLDKDNGTQNSTITWKYGANVQKPTSNPQKTWYTFTGWSPNIPDTFPAISGTHVAQYTLDTYTITYNLNWWINHIDNPTTYTYLSWDITLKAPTRDWYVFSWWMWTDVNSVTKTVTISTHSEWNRSYTAVWWEDRNHDWIDDDSELKYTVTINYVYSRWWTAAWAYTTWNQLSGFTYNVDSPIITNYHADKTNVSGTITGNVEVTVTYTPDHDTNNNWIEDEEESITPTPAPSWGSSSSWGGGWWKKPTDWDSHWSATDNDSQDSNNTGENSADNSEDGKWGENLNDDSKWNSADTGAWNISNSSSQWQIINYLNGSYTKEQVDAYNFAKSNWITTMPTIQQAKMNTSLTRIQMAKMLSNFAINVMKQEPDPEKWIVKFNDVTNKMDKQYDNAVTKAYQLWIMWQNMKNNEFRPNDEVTRAEFASALSRLLYQTDEWKYKSTWNYYIPHITRLYQEWIINNTNPKLKEKRWYVMLMLMRTVQ